MASCRPHISAVEGLFERAVDGHGAVVGVVGPPGIGKSRQVDQALCLTLVTNATVLWTTTYLGDALDALRADGYHVTDEAAAPLTPAQHDHINFYGTYSFDVETELHRERPRPLRSPAA